VSDNYKSHFTGTTASRERSARKDKSGDDCKKRTAVMQTWCCAVVRSGHGQRRPEKLGATDDQW